MNERTAKESTHDERSAVQISRDYNFPRSTVFGMFTDAKKAVKFWGPEGAEKVVFELDPRPGGAMRIHDRNTEGRVAKTTAKITGFIPPELFEFQSSTSFEDGATPFEALQTVRFEEVTPKRTRVTVRVRVLTTGSFPGDAESLENGFLGGWSQSLDMLQREL